MAKNTDYKDLSVDELKEAITTESSKLQQLKFNHAISGLESPISIRDTRRYIARLKTTLQERLNADK